MISDDLERMLNNWALWRSGAGRGGTGYAATSYDLEARGRRAEMTMPVIDGEAMLIDDLVTALPFEERQALHAHYLREVLLASPEAYQGNAGRRLSIPPSYGADQVARLLMCGLRTFERRLSNSRKRTWDAYCFRHQPTRG